MKIVQLTDKIRLIHGDCMDLLRGSKKNEYDLAVVDPPYFDGPNKLGYYGERTSKNGVHRGEFKKIGVWDVPDYDYYNELKRTSVDQIIWGINYFPFSGEVSGRIIWDKINDQSSFSKCEIASCSMIDTVQQFRFMWSGMLQGKSMNEGHIMQGNKKLNEKRIHPTQKPIALYKWIYEKYATPEMHILDTHLGSASSAIAAYYFGCEFTGIELDEEYFDASIKRFREYIAKYPISRSVGTATTPNLFDLIEEK